MPVTIVQKHLAFTRADEVVLLVRNVDAVAVDAMESILVGKAVEPEDTGIIYRFDGAGV